MAQLTDELIERIWKALHERQQSINRQMDESEKKYYHRLQENKRVLEESERKFFDQLNDKRRHLDETEEQYLRRMEENRILFESARERERQEAAQSRSKKLKQIYNIEPADHPVYFSIIKLFSERGYKFDDETLKLYWELITSITGSAKAEHSPEPQNGSGQNL